MKRKTFERAPCAIARSLDILGDWWTPLILRECLYGVHRFDDLQRWLGIGRNILTRRLATLVRQGVLERRPYQLRPLRHAYHLTQKGHDAAAVLLALMRFGEQWCFESGREPVILYDRRTGKRVRPKLVDAQTGRPLDVRELVAGPGPGFTAPPAVRRERFAAFEARAKAS